MSVLESDERKAPRPLRMDLSNEKFGNFCDFDFDLNEMLIELYHDRQMQKSLAGI